VKQPCPHCHRPFDDEWVVYCPVSRDLAEKLRGDGLTTATPVNMKLLGDDTIVITEIRVDLGSVLSPLPLIDGSEERQ
jgi:hypothetical protein